MMPLPTPNEVGAPASQDGPSPSVEPVPVSPVPASVPCGARALAERLWDAGHERIAGQAADASWMAQQAHIDVLTEYLTGTQGELRLCGYCKSWNRKPCGDGCCLQVNDPTWNQVCARGEV